MVARKQAEVMSSSTSNEDDDLEDVEDVMIETIPLTPSFKVSETVITDDSKEHDEASSRDEASSFWVAFFKTRAFVFLMQIANIMAWYWTNGMNGIAMQSYAEKVNDPSLLPSAYLRFFSTIALTGVVTCFQLLLGALIGRFLLFSLNKTITWQQITSTHSLPLSGLHALGSIATNLGFMYGKASLVQVIKLLEPFETLMLSQVFFKEGKCSIGIVSSMMVVVGAAMSLLKLQSTPPHPLSILFAILSGLTLSCRNVLQRKHHHQDTAAIQHWSKLEKSVVQFTQLSYFSGLWTGQFALVIYLMVQPHFVPCNYQVLLWHPLYNVFSMITLGFCSALTHSLLNAGKRVFAICMAMLWFREGLNPATLAGLALVGIGGFWYSLESKRKETSSSPEYDKLVKSLIGLAMLLWFQGHF